MICGSGLGLFSIQLVFFADPRIRILFACRSCWNVFLLFLHGK